MKTKTSKVIYHIDDFEQVGPYAVIPNHIETSQIMKNTKPKSTKPTKPKNDEVTIEECLLAITSTLNHISEETYELRHSADQIVRGVRAWQKVVLAFAVLTIINTIWLFIK